MSAYTDADVEAAKRALMEPRLHVNTSRGRQEQDARVVLDEVAPAIAARALRELADAMDRGERGGIDDWGIRNVYAVNLRTYADEIERDTP